MGGRSKLSPLGEDIGFFDERSGPSRGVDMGLAKFNPQAGYRNIDSQKSLGHIENDSQKLKHERLFVMDEDGYIISAVDGAKGSVEITPGARSKMTGNVVTHNHPRTEKGVDGGTFSVGDIKTLGFGAGEMRAVGQEGTYSMKAGNKADPSGLHAALIMDKKPLIYKQQEIATRVQRAYERGAYRTEHDAKADSFNRQMNVISNWYANNAQKHGYTYSFTPSEQRTPVTIETPKRRTQKQITRDKRGIDYGKEQAKKTLGMSGGIDVEAFMAERDAHNAKITAAKRKPGQINPQYTKEEKRTREQVSKDKKGIDYGKEQAKKTLAQSGKIDVDGFIKSVNK